MKQPLNAQKLSERIRLNYERLSGGDYYQIGQIFVSPPAEYDWPGDKEGRALLAFVDHYEIFGQKIPCMGECWPCCPKS